MLPPQGRSYRPAIPPPRGFVGGGLKGAWLHDQRDSWGHEENPKAFAIIWKSRTFIEISIPAQNQRPKSKGAAPRRAIASEKRTSVVTTSGLRYSGFRKPKGLGPILLPATAPDESTAIEAEHRDTKKKTHQSRQSRGHCTRSRPPRFEGTTRLPFRAGSPRKEVGKRG